LEVVKLIERAARERIVVRVFMSKSLVLPPVMPRIILAAVIWDLIEGSREFSRTRGAMPMFSNKRWQVGGEVNEPIDEGCPGFLNS
jgi:hypothetical protein|tara:strand:- start:3985 stop:4242 length:258 start_codon:yes stop_codon:yes gene_type:complete